MSYYIISEDGGRVLESSSTMSEREIQEAADYFGCDVYAIRGEHSGYSAVCSKPTEPAAHHPAAEVAIIGGPMTPRQFAERWYEGAPESESEETEQRITGLAAAISTHFIPHLPMADEGQTRLHTDAEMLDAVAQAEQRVFRALSKALGGPGWTWLPETRRKLTRQVRKVMSKMGKRPEVSNV